MANGFSGPVAQIVDNYLERLKKGLKGIPAKDQDELVKEITLPHLRVIPAPIRRADEVARILRVLDKLGEPAAVISARMPEAMVTLGKKKKLPFLILAGRPHRLLRRAARPGRIGRGHRPYHRRPGPHRLLLHLGLQPDPDRLAERRHHDRPHLQSRVPRSLDRHLSVRLRSDLQHGHLHRRGAPYRGRRFRAALAGVAHDAGDPVRLPAPVRKDQELAQARAGVRPASSHKKADTSTNSPIKNGELVSVSPN